MRLPRGGALDGDGAPNLGSAASVPYAAGLGTARRPGIDRARGPPASSAPAARGGGGGGDTLDGRGYVDHLAMAHRNEGG